METGKGEVEDNVLALGFPVKWDVSSAAEAEVGNWSKNDLLQALSILHSLAQYCGR